MEPVEYLRALIRRWPIIAVGALIGALFAFLGTDPKPPPVEVSYSATNILLVNNNELGSETRVGTIKMAQVPLLVTSGVVPERVAKIVGFDGPPAALATEISVSMDIEVGSISFTAAGNDQARIVKLADTFSQVTVDYLTERQDDLRDRRLSRAKTKLDDLETELRELDSKIDPNNPDSVLAGQRNAVQGEYQTAFELRRSLDETAGIGINLTTQQFAQPVAQTSGGFQVPRTRQQRVPLAALVGALLGAGLALIVERLDARIRDRRRAEQAFGIPVLSELPTLSRSQRGRQIIVGPEQHHAAAEAFRSLRTSVVFLVTGGEQLPPGEPLGMIVVTSPGPAEGKTTTALNLAAALAETGRSVIVVNADFRRPAITRALVSGRRPALPGLASIGRVPAEDYLIGTDVDNLQLLDLAPLSATAGDLTRATVRMLGRVRQLAEVVIIDTPPLAVTTEALEFVPLADVVLLVAKAGATSAESAERAGELVRFAGASKVGVTITAAGLPRLRGGRYYDYYSKNFEEPEGGRRSRRRNPADAAEQDADFRPASHALDDLVGDRHPTASTSKATGTTGDPLLDVDLDSFFDDDPPNTTGR